MLDKEKKDKFVKVISGFLIVTIGFSAIGGAFYHFKPSANNYARYVQSKIEIMDDYSTTGDAYSLLDMYSKKMYKVLEYIEISKKLNKLDLKASGSKSEKSDKLLSVSEIDSLIEKYNKVNKDESELANLEQILNQQEKLVNAYLFEAYNDVSDYLLLIMKIEIGEKRNVDPLSLKLFKNSPFGVHNVDCYFDDGKVEIITNGECRSVQLIDAVVTLQAFYKERNWEGLKYSSFRNSELMSKIYHGNEFVKEIYNKETKKLKK